MSDGLTVSAGRKGTAQYTAGRILPAERPFYRAIKRCFDIAFSIMAGLLLLMPMLLIAVWVKLDSRGPVIFKQDRLGLNGKRFVIYKFRTMYPDAECNGPQWAKRNDDRCTAAGRFLRKSRLDELPQLWNIIKGDMSVVGPRPERACFYALFEAEIPGFSNRMAVTPGLTGWAQVNGGYDLRPEEKIIYDMEYIQNRSVKLDLICILKTARLIFTHEGAR